MLENTETLNSTDFVENFIFAGPKGSIVQGPTVKLVFTYFGVTNKPILENVLELFFGRKAQFPSQQFLFPEFFF